jgi:hypothetical protein
MNLADRHTQALDRFRLVDRTERDQRQRELEDLRFDAGDQWSDDAKVARGGSPAEGTAPAVPPRPMIVVRSMDQPIAQVVNQARQARLAIKISPKSDGADQETADLLGGLIRSIEYESRAQSVYLGVGAYLRAVICGRGAARVEKAYASEAPGEWDQVLRITGVPNAAAIYLDPWADDVNDPAAPRWGFETLDLSEDDYRREYGDSALATADTDSILTSLSDPKNPWITADTNGKPIYRVAKYWFIDEATETDVHPDDPTRTREVVTRTVMVATMNGIEFIDPPQPWDGTYIPIARVVGVEKNVGGERIWEGMVRPNIGPCRMLNFGASTVMENLGLSTRGKWIGYTGQFEGHPEWDTANTRNWSKLEANATSDDTGTQVLPLPTWSVANPDLQPALDCVSLFTNFIRTTSGVPDAALGNVNPSDRSGSAIKQLQQASEQGTSNYGDNLRRFIEHIGHLLLDLIPAVYDRPGRLVHVVTGQTDDQSAVLIKQPYLVGNDGRPMPVLDRAGKPIMDPAVAARDTQGAAKYVDFSKGIYSVTVDIGKSFATRRQEAVGAMTDLAAAAPELLPKYADLLVKAMDIPESEAIAERLAPPSAAGGGSPAIQAQMQQLMAENQQLKQAQAIDQAKQQAQIQIAQLDSQTRLQIETMKEANDLKKTFIQVSAQLAAVDAKTDAENARSFVDAEAAGISKVLDLHMKKVADAVNVLHDHATQNKDHAHELAMAVVQHQQALEQGQQATALAPPPADPAAPPA